MKIEKINTNQIKCFLSKGDLLSRQIKVSELAYGTEKAQELFKDMMDQANNEFGFEVENTPLMIEAIPLSTDSIMLIITKVDNPDDLESKFAGLPGSKTRKFKKKETVDETYENNDASDPTKKSQTTNAISAFFLYEFSTLDDVSAIAPKLLRFTIDSSTLYRNPENNKYYLALISTSLDRLTCKVIRGVLSEYSDQVISKKNILNYYDEHYETIIKEKALKILVSI